MNEEIKDSMVVKKNGIILFPFNFGSTCVNEKDNLDQNYFVVRHLVYFFFLSLILLKNEKAFDRLLLFYFFYENENENVCGLWFHFAFICGGCSSQISLSH